MSTALATQPEPEERPLSVAEQKLIKVQEELRLMKLDAEIEFGPAGMVCRNMAALWRLSKLYSQSQLVPKQFQGKPEDCCIALQMAIRLKCDPFMFMQSCYVVHGRPGLESKLAIALANKAGVFKDRIKFRLEGQGDKRSCTAYAHDADTGELCEQTVTMAMAKAEGWVGKPQSKWQTMPDLMLQYRAAMFLIRLSCPEVLMGMQSTEELIDVLRASTGPAPPSSVEELTERLSKSDRLADRLDDNTIDEEREPQGSEPETPQNALSEGARLIEAMRNAPSAQGFALAWKACQAYSEWTESENALADQVYEERGNYWAGVEAAAKKKAEQQGTLIDKGTQQYE